MTKPKRYKRYSAEFKKEAIKRATVSRDVFAVQKQYLELNIQVQRTTEALDQGHRTGLGRCPRQPSLLDQMRRNCPVHNPEHPPKPS